MDRQAWGKAKREVLALKSEIVALISSGSTLVEAFKILSDAGRLTVGESTFFRHAKAIRDECQADPKPPQPPFELTPEVLAWLAAAPKPVQASATTPSQSNPQTPAAAVPAAAQADSSSQPIRRSAAGGGSEVRIPAGAGKEPEVPKFKGLKAGGDHW
jgi:hypothetical protein